MRLFVLLLVFALPLIANAFQWNECNFTIQDDPGNIGPKQPDGYKIYISDGANETPVDLGNSLEYPCESVFDIYIEGDFTATATAYNEGGESDRSQAVQFTIDSAPPTKPNSPGLNVQIRNITLR